MAELWKDKLNHDSLREFALAIQADYHPFKIDEFLTSTIDETWGGLELLARGRKITENLGKFLPENYEEALGIIDQVIATHAGLAVYSFPNFIEMFGQDEKHWDASIAALARYTQYASSEFAVRPFIIKHQDRMMAQMFNWSKHENEHIRRLASEGCRPALPWGVALVNFKKDPSPVLPILEQLKTDPSLYVRRSVANNLNDISKTHPDLIAKLARDWHGKNPDTDWIIKHACRTLLKQGNREVLALFGFQDTTPINVSDLCLDRTSISIGEDLKFSFTISNEQPAKVRLEYAINYVKANGKRSRKVFQISESKFGENQSKNYSKKHSFADVSIRKHYPGTHSVTIIVNGVERGTQDFTVS